MNLHPLTLKFSKESSHLEIPFQDDYFRASLPLTRAAVLIAVFFYSVFGILDAVLMPEKKADIWFIRFAVVDPALIAVFLLSFTKSFQKYANPLLSAVSILAGTGIIWMIVIAPPPVNYSYYAGLMLLFMWSYAFARISFLWASLIGWVLVVFYQVAAIGIIETPLTVIISNNFFFISANIMGMIACYSLEYSARRNYFLTRQIEKEREKTDRINLALEQEIEVRSKAENALRENDQRFRLITDNIRDTVWLMDMNLHTTWISPSVEKTWGFPLEELKRRPWKRHLTPASFELVQELIGEQLTPERLANPSEDISVETEIESLRKDGSKLWVDMIVTLLRNERGAPTGFLGIARDTTERRKMEDALRESQEIFTSLVNAIPDMIIRSDLQGTILYVNENTLQISGFQRDEIEGHNMLDFIALEDHPRVIQNVFLMMENKLGPREYKIIMKDGSRIPFEVNGDILRNKDGSPFGIVNLCRNISDRKRAEDALRQAHTELEQRVAERTCELTAANINLKELFQKQEINIDLAKNILAMINYRPHRHKQLPNNIEMFFTACYLPCYAEGGDHFFIKDFSEMRPGIAKTAISLKDQSGHEVSCILRSIITDLIHNALLVQTPDLPIEETITLLNKEICELPFFGDDNFFTSVDAEINHKNLKMRYVSSGHPPFLFIRGRDVVCLPSLESQARNLPIGVFQSVDFMSGEIQLQKGDKMIFFTDGLTDLPHMSGQPVLNAEDMKDMLAAIVRDEPRLPVSILMARLFNRINGQEGDSLVIPRSLYDDITLMGLELENGNYEYEDIVRPQNLEDMDDCVNRLFQKISAEWKEMGFSLPETRLRMVLDEAMVNAWTHGNREDPQKMIVVRRRYGNDAVLEVIDEGKGFDYKTFYDPTRKDNLLKPRGRGNFIMRLLTEETQWKDGGRHLIAYFAREYQTERTIRPFSGFNLWRKLRGS